MKSNENYIFFYRYAGGFGVFIKLIKGVTKSFNTDYELQQVCNQFKFSHLVETEFYKAYQNL